MSHLDDALERAEKLQASLNELHAADTHLSDALTFLPPNAARLADRTQGLRSLLDQTIGHVRAEFDDRIERAGRLLGRSIVVAVRSNGKDKPIVWLTGNAYMPALRHFSTAERVWALDAGIVWEVFTQAIETELEAAQIYMAAPEDDNALYGVDLRVWEYVPEEEREDDTLTGEWRRQEGAV